MPPIGGTLEAAAQSAMGDASFAAIHAITAKVGEAARVSQPDASRNCQAPEIDVAVLVIVRLPVA
jgi:hypothetical protein